MEISATHGRVDDEDTRDNIESVLVNNSNATVEDISSKTWEDSPPVPLNLSYAQQKFPGSPSQVLSNLQTLYDKSYTTYPRTSNQQYNDDFNFAEKVLALGMESSIDVPDFNGNFDATKGKSFDPAHPPITPTTNVPSNLGKWEGITYERVARHFLATLMGPAAKQKITYVLDVDGVEFEVEQYRMVEMGYFDVYGKYKQVYDDAKLDWDEGDVVSIEDWVIEEKETEPPDLWTSSELVEKMENKGLGTSATRGSMIDKVQYRGYANNDDGVGGTTLGKRVIRSLGDYAPRITDPSFTSELQNDLDDLRAGDRSYDSVVMNAREWVADVCIGIKKNEEDIGQDIVVFESGCSSCGGDMYLRSGKNGLFYGCSEYPDCEETLN